MTESRATGPDRSRNGAAGGLLLLLFVAAVLVALAVVPAVLGSRTAAAEEEITEVLEPARLLGTRLSLLQAQQMARFQAFLLTGDSAHVAPYLALTQEERRIYQRLEELGRRMDLEVRERVARLSPLSARWHLGHREAFASEEGRRAAVAALDTELERYAELQAAALELERIIGGEVEAGRRRMAAIRVARDRFTVVLSLLALIATAALAVLAYNMRELSREAESRRREAVRARREIDALLEATSDGVLGMDLEGRCTSLNRAGVALLGFTERELAGRDIHDTLFHARADGTLRMRDASPLLRALREGGQARSGEDEVMWRKDGTSFPARWVLQPMVDGTTVRGGVLTFADMSETREREEALRRAVRAREEVVTIVSHDLKNPLGVVAGAAELLIDLPLDEEGKRKQAEIIRRSAEGMKRLVEDLLDLSRIEAGALVVRPARMDVGEVLEGVAEDFAAQARDAGVTVEVTVAPGTPRVRMDGDRTTQALSNLVVNALRYSSRGGVVTLFARPGAEAGTVDLGVSDQGPGIPAEERERIFHRFWQANRQDRTGAGLGLAIVRGIARAHGGDAFVASREGEGATFVLRLPVDGPTEADA
ncbi:MAG: ATP-binding protein [Gemmatimonadota bacterium]